MIEVVLIGGVPRSGTGLARRMLGSHPQVYLPPFELAFHRRLEAGDPVTTTIDDLTRQLRWLDVAALDASSHAALFATVLAEFRRCQSVPVTGDKTPELEHHMEWYLRACGRTQLAVVHLVRHPVDVIASHLHARWNTEERTTTFVGELATRWRRSAEIAAGSTSDRVQRLAIRYEDLVADPCDTARRLCGLIDLEAGPHELERMVDLVDYPLHVNSSFGELGEATVGGVRRLGSRRPVLNEEEVAVIAEAAGSTAARWGYTIE